MNYEKFIQYLKTEKRVSPHTVEAYERDLSQFFAFLEAYEISREKDIEPVIIRNWQIELIENGVSPRSVSRKLSALKSWYKYLLKQDIVKVNPFLKITNPKISQKLPVYVKEKEMEKLSFLDEEGLSEFEQVRNRLIIELLYSTGMRRAELIGLKERDIDFYNKTIKVLGKRNKERLIPFGAELERCIKEYQEAKEKKQQELGEGQNLLNEYLLITERGQMIYPSLVYRVVTTFLQNTTLEKKSPHVMRHTFATHLLNNGADINAIKELLGHSSLAATQVYTHNTIEKLKKTYKTAHPRANK